MEGLDLEVDSVVDLRVPVLDESDIEEGVVDAILAAGSAVGSIAGSVPGIITASAPAMANAWRRELSGQGGRAGTGRHCEHAIRDGWSTEVAESLGFLPGSIAISSAVPSATWCYEHSERVVAYTDFLPASLHVPVPDTPSGTKGHRWSFQSY